MIIVNLKGGLGNQMFQYAFGRAYSLLHGDEMKLDVSNYPKQTLRTYGLEAFNIKENIASDEEIKVLKYPHGIFSKLWRGFSKKILRRYYPDYHPSLLKFKPNGYFDGYFQSEQYFIANKEIIQREFTLINELSSDALTIRKKIEEVAIPVSLHIRRGDYYSDTATSKIHASVTLDYYKNAVQTITNGYPEAHFFIFSDDIDWVKEHLISEYPSVYVYVSKPSIKDYEELILMSRCCHNIISNSTFSWWGAWLNQNPDKIVIAPKKWTNKIPDNHPNIIPHSWTRL